MNRNTLIGFSLIAVVLILFSYLNTPSQEEIEAYNRQQDSIEAVKKQIEASNQNATEAKPVAVVDSTALFFPSISDSAAAAKGKGGSCADHIFRLVPCTEQAGKRIIQA